MLKLPFFRSLTSQEAFEQTSLVAFALYPPNDFVGCRVAHSQVDASWQAAGEDFFNSLRILRIIGLRTKDWGLEDAKLSGLNPRSSVLPQTWLSARTESIPWVLCASGNVSFALIPNLGNLHCHLPGIALLVSSVCIELISSSTRVTSVKSINLLHWQT